MPSILTLFKIFLLSLLFTGALFGLQTYLSLHFSDTFAEENYIEKSIYNEIETPVHISDNAGDEIILEPITPIQVELDKDSQIELPTASQDEIKQIFFTYIPTTLRASISDYRDSTRDFMSSDDFEDKIQELTVEFHKDIVDVRGTMKNKTIKIFDPLQLGSAEFISLFTHEFAHYLDIYYFSKSPFGDISQDFYDISWESTKTMQKGQLQTDFVSGYAMTNKYEDFAETLTYYIFHNKDFQQKALTSSILELKYQFLTQQLFQGDVFVGTDFSSNEIQDYYWDITKINIDTENFLQYLQKDI